MKAVVQRVRWAEVSVDGKVIGRIERGLLVYVGVAVGDTAEESRRLADKVVALRIFEDDSGKLNRSVQDVRGGVLAIPNFTLLADARKGRRPAFVRAAPPEAARPAFAVLLSSLGAGGMPVAQGAFGASMQIRSEADGPVNIILEMTPGEAPPVRASAAAASPPAASRVKPAPPP